MSWRLMKPFLFNRVSRIANGKLPIDMTMAAGKSLNSLGKSWAFVPLNSSKQDRLLAFRQMIQALTRMELEQAVNAVEGARKSRLK
jgi:hypothetical protein